MPSGVSTSYLAPGFVSSFCLEARLLAGLGQLAGLAKIECPGILSFPPASRQPCSLVARVHGPGSRYDAGRCTWVPGHGIYLKRPTCHLRFRVTRWPVFPAGYCRSQDPAAPAAEAAGGKDGEATDNLLDEMLEEAQAATAPAEAVPAGEGAAVPIAAVATAGDAGAATVAQEASAAPTSTQEAALDLNAEANKAAAAAAGQP